jgi:hypothetical protein
MQDMDRIKKETLKKDIFCVEEVIAINEIELLNFEKNERKLSCN